jgi:hypothetical protein
MNDFWKVGDSCSCIVVRFTGIKQSRCGEGSAEEQKRNCLVVSIEVG